MPDAPAYSASKAALLSYRLALRDAVEAEGIRVVVACPGFVATAMSGSRPGPGPGEISDDDAAERILAGLRRNTAMIGFPLVPFWLSRLSLLVREAIRRRGHRNSYFMETAQSLLRTEVSRTFRLASAGFGLTEVRCLFLGLNVAL
ncbi:MAG: SDR family NAD(P)-dependent oxidoreductase [Rhodospirillales bacterium]|nr:SDR family NAD(P)-dependent oxidoreductase [Rhodospirillales bacterium]